MKEYNHNVYIAHNLLISKNDELGTEEAEFYFIVDRRKSTDKGVPLNELRETWHSRLQERLQRFSQARQATIEIEALKINRPRGVGVPCFFACNAKQKDGIGARTAVQICRMLEGHGFKPVNIDIAAGGEGLQEQVKDLIAACRFMVILHCPEEGLKDIQKESYHPSHWVMFEESVMLGKKGNIIRFRFDKVMKPSFWHGFVEREIPMNGANDDLLADFGERLERWSVLTYEQNDENINAPGIEDKHLERDLVFYYGGREIS